MTQDLVVKLSPTQDAFIYSDAVVNLIYSSKGEGKCLSPDTGIIIIQVDTMNVVTPIPTGLYDPLTRTYILPSGPAPTGAPIEPGSFAGNPYQQTIPPELNTDLASGILLPAVPSVAEAINQVVKCNCDCWLV